MTQDSKIKHALVVDDDPLVLAMAETHLLNAGVEKIQSARDGVEALAAMDEAGSDPEFILCDLNMPNMDGVEFMRHLEKRRFMGAVAILSGEEESVVSLVESLAQSHKLNFAGKILKPFNAKALQEILATVMSGRADRDGDPFFAIDPATLRHAISNGEIIAYHQPKVDAKTGVTIGTEILARWKHPEWGVIAPAHFIGMAEQTDLIGSLTESIFRQAVLDIQRWRTQGFNAKCSVNLSPKMLFDVDLPDTLAGMVTGAGLDPSQFVLEITETSLVEQAAEPMEILARLRLKRFDLSIDDFGTGHSNIDTLRQFPFNELKIDRSFVSGMVDDQFCLETVRSSVQFARKLGLRIVAEGIETEAEWSLTRGMGIDELQGYFFGRPMLVSDFPINRSFQLKDASAAV